MFSDSEVPYSNLSAGVQLAQLTSLLRVPSPSGHVVDTLATKLEI